jgi:hypothetical protein
MVIDVSVLAIWSVLGLEPVGIMGAHVVDVLVSMVYNVVPSKVSFFFYVGKFWENGKNTFCGGTRPRC